MTRDVRAIPEIVRRNQGESTPGVGRDASCDVSRPRQEHAPTCADSDLAIASELFRLLEPIEEVSL